MEQLFKEIEDFLKEPKRHEMTRLASCDRYAVFIVGKCLIVEDKHLQVTVSMPLMPLTTSIEGDNHA